MAAPAFDWLRHFQLLLWNRWTEFNEPDRKQDLNVLYQVCVVWGDGKNKMAALLLIDWDSCNFSFETTEWKSMKLDRKQDFNAVYQVFFCFFLRIQKSRLLPCPIHQKGSTLYSGARYVDLWAPCYQFHVIKGRFINKDGHSTCL